MTITYFIFYALVLLFSVIAHEVAHGAMADSFGDKTARNAGRLTMNPLPHLDPLGSIILPLLCIVTGASFFFGWAKPVPYNPYNLRNQRWGEPLVAAAGVLMNFFIAFCAAVILHFFRGAAMETSAYADILITIITVNISLGVFNLLPLPPFDGMRIITSLVPTFGRKVLRYVDTHATLFLLASLYIAFHLFDIVGPFVTHLIYLAATL